jgi:hypothetical protein
MSIFRFQLKRQHADEAKGSIGCILKSVVEEKVTDFSGVAATIGADHRPFPDVVKVDPASYETAGPAASGKRQSIFAKKMADKASLRSGQLCSR